MDKQTAAVAITSMLVGAIIILSTVQMWLSSRNTRAKASSGAPSAAQLDRLEARLVETQRAVETMAVEVERIAEGQRFTTRLLSERGERVALPSQQREPR